MVIYRINLHLTPYEFEIGLFMNLKKLCNVTKPNSVTHILYNSYKQNPTIYFSLHTRRPPQQSTINSTIYFS